MARSEATKQKSPNDEYYTPRHIFDALGIEFDLDCTAPEGGVPWLPAKKYYTEADDALVQPWEGTVWLNPPYSNPRPFIEKFIEHGDGVALVQVSKALWFKDVWERSDVLCFPSPHLKFEHKIEGAKGIFMPVILIGMGQKAIAALIRSNLGRIR